MRDDDDALLWFDPFKPRAEVIALVDVTEAIDLVDIEAKMQERRSRFGRGVRVLYNCNAPMRARKRSRRTSK